MSAVASRAVMIASALAGLACTPPRTPRAPLAVEPVRSAEEIANEQRVLSREERLAALSLTIERFLGAERQARGADAMLFVVLEMGQKEGDPVDAPQITGVVYTRIEAIHGDAETHGPIFYLAVGAPVPSSAKELVMVPLERRAAPTDPAAGDAVLAAGDCAIHVPVGAAAWLEYCHYDAGHEGD